MRILITGGSGLFGQYLNIRLSKNNSILTTYNTEARNCKEFNSRHLDINCFESISEIFKDFLPEIVVHTAAVSSPETAAALASKEVFGTNVNATLNLAKLCRDFNSRLIYTSTDLVYAGYRGSMLTEEAKIIPISIYAETKLMGEVKIKETFDNYIILRTALLYGFGINGKENHFHQMYTKLQSGQKIKLFNDQFRTPIALNDAARIIDELCTKGIRHETINLGGLERVSRLELGYKLCDVAWLNKNLIESISMNDLPDYPQVADVSMNTDKLHSFGIKQKTIEESFAEILNNF